MAMEVRFLERLRKKARNGVRDWLMATIAFYGPTLSRAILASNSPGRILAGAKPADLPVAQSTKFEFVMPGARRPSPCRPR
jgi:hypothetical protein